MNTIKILLIIVIGSLVSCGNKGGANDSSEAAASGNGQAAKPATKAPDFNADSAYAFTKKQVDFGPRVPNTEAHKACGDYLISELKRFGAEMHVQEMNLKAYNGEYLQSRNIIGSYNKDNPKRILLFAHWDTRPYADHDPDVNRQNTPIDGADDGASGVGVLLEMARQFRMKDPGIGIDIIFFDSEDYGPPATLENRTPGDWWALGAQFWAKNPHVPNYKAEYGILLDMVGARDATFFKEGFSVRYASRIVERVWNKARDLGYGRFFINADGGSITDDHQYVIEGRGIPCIDIINLNPDSKLGHGFGDYWHTHADNMDNIDTKTLKAVGQTVLEEIYKD